MSTRKSECSIFLYLSLYYTLINYVPPTEDRRLI